ncbi:glycosyltransferase [Paenibacillus sp. FSL M7-1046]|uniref:glycosyltransferase n=1 Tax=Paenibacillus sp. FSL M7-1046 TaxID=2975315 RepID=UPI0030F827D3
MRIAIVSNKRSGLGGMEAVFRTVMQELVRNQDEVKMFLMGGSLDKNWLRDLDCVEIGDQRTDNALRRRYSFTLPLFREISQYQPEVIIGCDPNVVCYCKWMTRILNRKIPVGSWVHNELSTIWKVQLLKYADFHLSISKGIAEQIQAVVGSEAQGKIFVTHNPVDVEVLEVARPEVPTFLYIGRLENRQKRVRDLIDSLAKLEGEWKAIIVGDGPDREEVYNLAQSYGINDRLEWLGWKKNPWAEIPRASALVLTSNFEGFPLVLLEAMARGIPCLSTDCQHGPAEIVIPEGNGWLVSVGDVEGMAGIMQLIVDQPEHLPDPQFVKESVNKFSITNVVDNIRGIIEQQLQMKVSS